MTTISNEWPSYSTGYKIICKIGCGSSGTVWKAQVLEGRHRGENVAIKKIELEKCADNKITEIRKSMLLANLLAHPNILSYKIAFIHKQDLWLVSELMEGGSIDNIIKTKYPDGIKDQTLLATIIKEVLKGLRYLHQNNQIHRDIKGSSILIGSDGSVKISEFGIATQLKVGEKKNTCIGSPCWMAPEVLDQDHKIGYDFKADIWSLGITVLELANGNPPNCELTTMKLILKTLNDEPPKLKDETCWDEHIKEFISYCLVKNPAKRKTSEELLKNCKSFLNRSKGQEYIKEKLLKGLNSPTLESNEQAPLSSRRERKSCSIQFDFGVEQEENKPVASLEDLQVKTDHNHLTKQESEFILQQSLRNSLAHMKRSSVDSANRKIKDKIQMKASCSAASRLVHKEKSEKISLSNGDYGNDFPFLTEEEI